MKIILFYLSKLHYCLMNSTSTLSLCTSGKIMSYRNSQLGETPNPAIRY